MNDYTNLLVTNTATGGTNLTLTYGLLEPPAWASIDTNTGVITLTPDTPCLGNSTNLITTIVTDNGNPPDSATNSFTLVVTEVNTAPFWPGLANTPTNQTAIALSNLTFDASAIDTNCPPLDLTYSLTTTLTGANLPVINFANGIVTWTPDQTQSPSNYIFTVIATNYDQYAPTNQYLTATNTYIVTVFGALTLTNLQPQTNSISAGGIEWYVVNVPTNADFATNILLFADAPLSIWFSTNVPPTITNLGDVDLIPASTGGSALLGTNTAPAYIVPGGTYYLGVQNTNSFPVPNYAVEVDFHLIAPALTNAIPIFSITTTNIGGTNDFLLTWFAPTNDLFEVEWTPTLVPTNWSTFSNIISYGTFISPTNSQFNFLDDGSQTGGFLDPMRFYRLILLP
jgi:hypothetical protein